MASQRTIRLEETTVADIDGWMVTVANIMAGEWTDHTGATMRGLTVEIGLYDEDRGLQGEPTVGAGAVLRIDGRVWRVDAVVAGGALPGGGVDNGYVSLTTVA